MNYVTLMWIMYAAYALAIVLLLIDYVRKQYSYDLYIKSIKRSQQIYYIRFLEYNLLPILFTGAILINVNQVSRTLGYVLIFVLTFIAQMIYAIYISRFAKVNEAEYIEKTNAVLAKHNSETFVNLKIEMRRINNKYVSWYQSYLSMSLFILLMLVLLLK